jgi:hypothetical protein
LAYLDDDCEANPAWLVIEASAGRFAANAALLQEVRRSLQGAPPK